jgi:hypothetical protein
MRQERLRSVSLAILAWLATSFLAQPALACSVCFGDPSSAMGQGARAGVFALLAVVGVVLTGLAALLIFWWRRATHLEGQLRASTQGLGARRA